VRRDQYRKPDGTIGGYNPDLADFLPKSLTYSSEARVLDKRLTGIRIDLGYLRKVARRELNGNFWHDFPIIYSRDAIAVADGVDVWTNEGGQ
jgi:hypothetical protein